VRVLSCISGDGRYNEVAGAHRARANMMVCSKSMINVATQDAVALGHSRISRARSTASAT
jgi:nitrogenase molybdenum-iron protein alpha/beta subunit